MVEGQGEHARVQVRFERAGSKWLVLAYANLQPAWKAVLPLARVVAGKIGGCGFHLVRPALRQLVSPVTQCALFLNAINGLPQESVLADRNPEPSTGHW